MKDVVAGRNLRVARYESVQNVHDYQKKRHKQQQEQGPALSENNILPLLLQSPVVVKTPQGFSTTDVFVCHTDGEVENAVRTICGCDSSDEDGVRNNDIHRNRLGPDGRRVKEALIEEYIDGTEFAVNLMALPSTWIHSDTVNNDATPDDKRDGIHALQLVVTDVWKYEKNEKARYGSADICNPYDPALNVITKFAIDVASAVGIECGAAHVELKATLIDGIYMNPCLIEVGARLSGGRKASMTQAALAATVSRDSPASDSPWNPFRALIASHCGFVGFSTLKSSVVHQLYFFKPRHFVRHLFLPIEESGQIKMIHGLVHDVTSCNLSTFHSMAMLIRKGDTVERTTDITTCAGFLWLVGERHLVNKDTKTFLETFKVEIVKVSTESSGTTHGKKEDRKYHPASVDEHRITKRLKHRNDNKKTGCLDRLLSICQDIESLKKMEAKIHQESHRAARFMDWMIVPNERCGSWYVPPSLFAPTVYFKSTDGHVNTWNFSLKRLNLPLVELLHKKRTVILVDSSNRKVLPDSFSRTIPIWAAVLNRIVVRYRQETIGAEDGKAPSTSHFMIDDPILDTPKAIVSLEEHKKILQIIDEQVNILYKCRAIVNPQALVACIDKPIRVRWMDSDGHFFETNDCWRKQSESDGVFQSIFDLISNAEAGEDSLTLICWNPSRYGMKNEEIHVENDEHRSYQYIPGAADDQESWSRQLTPTVFWKHHDRIKPALNDENIEYLIDEIISTEDKRESSRGQESDSDDILYNCDRVGELKLWLGSRRSGRPPDCWKHFDAILNVTVQQYDGILEQLPPEKYYLQLPVEEGKRDKSELERWMPVGVLFLIYHLQEGRRVLVHCAQGRDRSVAVVVVAVILLQLLEYPVRMRKDTLQWDFKRLFSMCASQQHKAHADDSGGANLSTTKNLGQSPSKYRSSGLPESTANALLAESGKQLFLKWIHSVHLRPVTDGPLANKEVIRICLHLIKSDRPVAEPTRSTMQKINRFLMSSPLYLASMKEKSPKPSTIETK
jgi:tRNA A64-2'-O-ribosylphosphate transferase